MRLNQHSRNNQSLTADGYLHRSCSEVSFCGRGRQSPQRRGQRSAVTEQEWTHSPWQPCPRLPSPASPHRGRRCEVPAPDVRAGRADNRDYCTDCYLHRHLRDKMVGHKVLTLSYNQGVKGGERSTQESGQRMKTSRFTEGEGESRAGVGRLNTGRHGKAAHGKCPALGKARGSKKSQHLGRQRDKTEMPSQPVSHTCPRHDMTSSPLLRATTCCPNT